MKKEIYITEISEEDFRKLNLSGYKCREDIFSNVKKPIYYELNKVLDEYIKFVKATSNKDNQEALKRPVTICVFKDETFSAIWGIRHLYSTRDYFVSEEDFFKAKKKEIKSLYRIHLKSIKEA